MKTKLFTALALLAVGITAFVFKSSPENNTITPPHAPIDNDQFLITVADVGLDYGYAHLSDLHLNAWHKYTDANPRTDPYPNGWIGVTNDWFDEEPDNYRPQIVEIIRKNKSDFQLSSVMDRPKTAYTLLAQRSEYQAEQEDNLADHDLWFYTYRVSIDDPGLGITDVPDNTFGGGAMVKQCMVNTQDPESNADYILSGLKANHEQANKVATSQSQGDHFQKWHIMPRIRIPTGTPDNIPVCKIEIYDWVGGNPIIEKTILSTYFRRNPTQPYNGEYLEEYYFTPDADPVTIQIDAGDICPGDPRQFQNWYQDPANDPIKTDYRVYWYGACNMWIDYVRVENEPAHKLFKHNLDDHLIKEVDMAAYGHGNSNYILNNFYREEFEFNCLPCIRYVNNLINTYAQQTYGLDLQVMCNLNYDLLNVHRPDFGLTGYSGFTTAQLKKFLCTGTGGLRNIVNVSYPLEGWDENDQLSDRFGDNSGMQAPPNPNRSFHPPTLYSGTYNRNIGVLSYRKETTGGYEDWLQERIDFGSVAGGGFMQVMKMTDALSKEVTDLKLVNLPQAHLWWSTGHKIKEPSMEEQRLLVNLAISYGAKGIMYFTYGNGGEYDIETGYYYRGLTGGVEPDPRGGPFTPRHVSVYNQDKWVNIHDLNERLLSWGNTLMSFDNINRHSYSFRLEDERTDLLMHSYFMDVVSYVRGWDLPDCWEDAPDTTGDNPPEDIRYECNEDRYLQVATFKTTPDDGNEYFMIVNRRCSPYIDESSVDNIGGQRFIRVKFDQNSVEFPTFETWKITNIAIPEQVWSLPFLKSYTGYLDLGWFLPG